MAGIGRTVLSLRFFGEDLQPDELTQLLGAQPTQSHIKGDLSPSGRTQRTGAWWLRMEDREPGDLEAQVVSLFAGLTDDLAVWADLNARYQGDVFCGLFMESANEGLGLTPEMLLMIGQRGLRLGLDLYDPVSD